LQDDPVDVLQKVRTVPLAVSNLVSIAGRKASNVYT